MQEEHVQNEGDADEGGANDEKKRFVSTISFPYGDLDDAFGFAKAVHEVGGQSCLAEQVAGYLKVAPSGGAFRARLAVPRVFGLTDIDRGQISLTPLGMRIVDPSQEKGARVEAFLNVDLYRAIYEKYKGYTLPPAAALEREMARLGVSPKQTDKARQVFERAAKQAGFYWAGVDRLTLPVTRPESRPIDDTPLRDEEKPASDSGTGGGSGSGQYHPFIEGLLRELPEIGQKWPLADRAQWLTLAATAFNMIYKKDGGGEIELKVKGDESTKPSSPIESSAHGNV